MAKPPSKPTKPTKVAQKPARAPRTSEMDDHNDEFDTDDREVPTKLDEARGLPPPTSGPLPAPQVMDLLGQLLTEMSSSRMDDRARQREELRVKLEMEEQLETARLEVRREELQQRRAEAEARREEAEARREEAGARREAEERRERLEPYSSCHPCQLRQTSKSTLRFSRT